MKKKTKVDKIKQKRTIFLILVLMWMVLVFYFSHQPGDESVGTSSRAAEFIVKIISSIQELSIDERNEMIVMVNPIIRKIAHYSIYTLGGVLVINYINTYILTERKTIFYSIIWGSIYACTDEIHQIFIDGRSAQITDVLLDTLGVTTGVCIFLCVIEIVRMFKESKKYKVLK